MTPEDILRTYKNGTIRDILGLSKEISDSFPDAQSFIDEVEKIWNLQKRAVFKRIQTPPIIQISRASFGWDYREAQNEVYFTREYNRLKDAILNA